jgi:hypothetical protein
MRIKNRERQCPHSGRFSFRTLAAVVFVAAAVALTSTPLTGRAQTTAPPAATTPQTPTPAPSPTSSPAPKTLADYGSTTIGALWIANNDYKVVACPVPGSPTPGNCIAQTSTATNKPLYALTYSFPVNPKYVSWLYATVGGGVAGTDGGFTGSILVGASADLSPPGQQFPVMLTAGFASGSETTLVGGYKNGDQVPATLDPPKGSNTIIKPFLAVTIGVRLGPAPATPAPAMPTPATATPATPEATPTPKP